MTEIIALNAAHPLWSGLARFAEGCSWRAGAVLADMMRRGAFREWERVFAAVIDGEIAGFCTLTARDAMPEECPYTPFVGFVFVSEKHRGKRLSARLLEAAERRALSLGYGQVYLTSGEIGLYEKYGFQKLGGCRTIYGEMEQLFMKPLKEANADAGSTGL